jgi:hypothetical protein
MTSIAPYLILMPFGLIGAVRLWHGPRRPTAVLLLAGAAILACLIFFPQERFRVPIIDPVLIISAAASGRRALL